MISQSFTNAKQYTSSYVTVTHVGMQYILRRSVILVKKKLYLSMNSNIKTRLDKYQGNQRQLCRVTIQRIF